MTLFIADISHHQAGISIQALKEQGAAALIARVGQGRGRKRDGGEYGTIRDREWARHRAEAKRVGLPLVAYWYTGNLITPEENARLCREWMGDPTLPIMLDHEDGSGDVRFYNRVVTAFARAGLRVVLGYFPKWYYDAVGGGDLTGPPLVNSRYPSTAGGPPAAIYDRVRGDTHAAWNGYGGKQVALWQFTSQAGWAGRAIDANAFRGTRSELMALINPTKGADDVSATELFNHKINRQGSALGGSTTLGAVVANFDRSVELQRGDLAKLTALVAADKGVDVDALASAVVARQRELLEEVIREIVPDELAEDVVSKLGEKLADRP